MVQASRMEPGGHCGCSFSHIPESLRIWIFSELYIYPCVLCIFQWKFQKIKIKKNLGFNRQEHKEKQILKHKMFKFTNVQTQVVILFPFLIF